MVTLLKYDINYKFFPFVKDVLIMMQHSLKYWRKIVLLVELLPDIDPDIAAALEGDFNEDDEDNLLEDDFVLKANAAGDDGSVMPLERVSQTVNRSEMLERFGLVREERFSDESSDDDYEGEGGSF